MSLDRIIERKKDLYANNPQELARRANVEPNAPIEEISSSLLDALALQKLLSEKEAAKNQLAMSMQQNPNTIVKQNEKAATDASLQDIIQRTSGVLQTNDNRVRQQNAAMQQSARQGMQMAGLPQAKPNMQMAAGGIVPKVKDDRKYYLGAIVKGLGSLLKTPLGKKAAKKLAAKTASQRRAGLRGLLGINKNPAFNVQNPGMLTRAGRALVTKPGARAYAKKNPGVKNIKTGKITPKPYSAKGVKGFFPTSQIPRKLSAGRIGGLASIPAAYGIAKSLFGGDDSPQAPSRYETSTLGQMTSEKGKYAGPQYLSGSQNDPKVIQAQKDLEAQKAAAKTAAETKKANKRERDYQEVLLQTLVDPRGAGAGRLSALQKLRKRDEDKRLNDESLKLRADANKIARETQRMIQTDKSIIRAQNTYIAAQKVLDGIKKNLGVYEVEQAARAEYLAAVETENPKKIAAAREKYFAVLESSTALVADTENGAEALATVAGMKAALEAVQTRADKDYSGYGDVTVTP